MKRSQLEHVVRAAAAIAGVTDLLVLGSQSILGSYPEWELPSAATRSVEADLAVDVELAHLDADADGSALADLIDGAIGEGSLFHQTNGYYAQGVETVTATLGNGWRERLVPLVVEDARPVAVGWCLEPHDLWAAKAAAGRPKDRSFCAALVGSGLVDRDTCLARVGGLPPDEDRRAMVVLRHAFGAL